MGTVHDDGSTFGPNETVGPDDVVGDGASFIGANHGNYVYVNGPIIIGPGATFRYTVFNGNDDIIIGEGYTDAGHNHWNGAPVTGPTDSIGDSQSLSNGCCSQSLSNDGEEDPIELNN